ncbi:VanZ family protein [Pedobacter antarcticus]|uniref:Glycine cleavage system protein H n=2 Tax=Pedobacter antarcticus TaxID=34086 RepID=A0A081PJ36_9SPHI|nr:VanZ family protein [Pedobacter antarcticus]KEQ30709.1 glycine cleavage system protein H [Pedobacter antarcticus 4BY]SDM15464.1 VanZ like family protein [Pedobacter antarcticus]SFF14073.1 VanZ like family protein [Pedobacter antarcticus]
MNNKLKALSYQRWALAWTVFILILCTMKMPESTGSGIFFQGFDKLVHLGFFYVLTILLFYGKISNQHNYSFRSLTIFKIILLTFIVGASVEVIQYFFFPYRSAEWWDLGCDMIGVFMGVFSYVLLHRFNFDKDGNLHPKKTSQ